MSSLLSFNFIIRRGIANCSLKKCAAAQGGGSPPKKTALYDFHVGQGGKMVPFAGYLMPVQYSALSIVQSHIHTRKHASIFDVSHMLQTEIHGKDRLAFIESLVTGDIGSLSPGQGSLTLFTTPQGGIIDDLIVTNTKEDYLYVVSNAGCRDKDIPLLQEAEKDWVKNKGKDVKVVFREDLSLIAVQGPGVAKVLASLVPSSSLDLGKFYFMNSAVLDTIADIKLGGNGRITRCGYTGEDGVEISVPSDKIKGVVEALLDSKVDKVELAGLGARDSLRLEAGLCLYGNDMDENTTPVEAALAWLVGKGRRQRGDFPGAEKILEQLKDSSKVKKKRVGLIAKEGGPPPRSHMEIWGHEGCIGEITSGCPSPSLAPTNVAMGYVATEYAKVGTQLMVKVRNKVVPAEVVKIPFVKGKYYVPPKK